jgi:hypothetical protein
MCRALPVEAPWPVALAGVPRRVAQAMSGRRAAVETVETLVTETVRTVAEPPRMEMAGIPRVPEAYPGSRPDRPSMAGGVAWAAG